jgi:hypothetical protein
MAPKARARARAAQSPDQNVIEEYGKQQGANIDTFDAETVRWCLKRALKEFSSKSGDDAAPLVDVSTRCLSWLHAHAAGEGAACRELSPFRYLFIRRLVSLKDFGSACAQATTLLEQWDGADLISPCGGSSSSSSTESPAQVANILVGTALTLVLCWAEGQSPQAPDAITNCTRKFIHCLS